MDKIYLAAYKKFSDYELLKVVCDKITERLNRDETTFYVTTGESGDNTCMKYARDNGFKVEDWFPDEKFADYKRECMANGHWHEFYNVLKAEKNKYISMADHVVFVWDYDEDNNGVGCGMKMASKNNKTLSVVIPEKKEVHVFRPSEPQKKFVYSIANGTMTHVRTENNER